MSYIKTFIFVLSIFFTILSIESCQKKQDKIENKAISDLSIYNLPSKWTNQNGQDIEMKEFRGKVLVMVMIYTSCKAACPRLVADMRNIEARLPDNIKKNTTFIMISIDPKTDTPERLKYFAKENKMDSSQWVFLRSTDENTREFAAVLSVNYKKVSPLVFTHSNIISVFNQAGELCFQQEGLGVNSDQTIKTIIEEAKKI